AGSQRDRRPPGKIERAPSGLRVRTVTSTLRSRSTRIRALPMNPVPPVTTIRIVLPPLGILPTPGHEVSTREIRSEGGDRPVPSGQSPALFDQRPPLEPLHRPQEPPDG